MIDTHSAAAFHPHEVLAEALLARLDPPGTDGSHGLSHILQVWRNAAAIAATEPGCDVELLLAAAREVELKIMTNNGAYVSNVNVQFFRHPL